MNEHDYHRGYGLYVDSIDSSVTNLVANQGRKIIANLKMDICYGGFGRPIVDVPFAGHLSPADAYSRLVVRTGNHDNRTVVIVLAEHHKKPFVQITSSSKNTYFLEDVNTIKQAFASPIDFKSHKFSKYPRKYNNEQIQHFDNEGPYNFTSSENIFGQTSKPNYCVIGEVDKSVLDSFDFKRIRHGPIIQSLSIGKGIDFENPWNHQDLLEHYGVYLSIGPVLDIESGENTLKLSAIVGSGVIFNERNGNRDIDIVQNSLLELLSNYRLNDTAVAFGRRPMGTSMPYFMGPKTDIEKMISEIIRNASDFEVKDTNNDDTQVIKHMYYGLIRGDETCKKYAKQLKQKTKEIESKLPEGVVKKLLRYTLSEMN